MDCFKILSTAEPEQQYLIVYKPLKDYFLFSSAWSFERACSSQCACNTLHNAAHLLSPNSI